MEAKPATSSDASEATNSDSESFVMLLIKMTSDDNSRTYMDFASEKDAIMGIMLLFEALLKKKKSSCKVLAYTINDMFNFIDFIADLSLLTYIVDLD